ncbi:MAG TPA: hypothetical protein VIY49_25300 [Bryobacteraceae bacterium]
MRVVCLWAVLTLPVWSQAPPPAPGPAQARLNIVVVEGESAINNVKGRVNREPIVLIVDENQRPLAGAAVVFLLPSSGPGGSFVDGSKTLTVSTDAQGRAVAAGIHRNNLSGQMQIRVTASFGGQTVSTVITQTNVAGGSAGLSTTAKVLIVIGVAGGAAAGAILATRGGSSSSSSSSGPTAPSAISITAGTPSVNHP